MTPKSFAPSDTPGPSTSVKRAAEKGAPGARLVISSMSIAATVVGWALLATPTTPQVAPVVAQVAVPVVAEVATPVVVQVAAPPAWLTEPLVLPTLPPSVNLPAASLPAASQPVSKPVSAPAAVVQAPLRAVQAPARQVQAAPPVVVVMTSSSR